MTNAIQKFKASPSALAAKAAAKAIQKNCVIKKIMLLELDDGAFTDDSVKVKPHKGGIGIVLKCTCRDRLLLAVSAAKIPAKIVKGSKHWIAFPQAKGAK